MWCILLIYRCYNHGIPWFVNGKFLVIYRLTTNILIEKKHGLISTKTIIFEYKCNTTATEQYIKIFLMFRNSHGFSLVFKSFSRQALIKFVI